MGMVDYRSHNRRTDRNDNSTRCRAITQEACWSSYERQPGTARHTDSNTDADRNVRHWTNQLTNGISDCNANPATRSVPNARTVSNARGIPCTWTISSTRTYGCSISTICQKAYLLGEQFNHYAKPDKSRGTNNHQRHSIQQWLGGRHI